jgi:ribosomal protein L37AE/L43A
LRAKFKAAGDESGWIVVGAQRITRVVEAHGKLAVSVHIKANLRLKTGDKFKRQLLSEELRFERPVGVASREPEKVYSLGCPACGASQELTLRGTCASCGTAIGGGELDWQLTHIKTLARTDVGEGVISQAAEVGTNLPTVVDPRLKSRWRALTARDPQLTKELLLARFKMIFVAIQKGWTTQDAGMIRPHELDTLYDMHVYWLARFKEERIRNVLENLKVKRIELAKIDHDAWYDAVTVRIRAQVDDFYVDAEGNPLAGEAGREFTEYWTFIRRSGRQYGVPRAKLECPSCGAALDKVNQAGICEYCGNKVVTGDFDWVLATIEQDEEYRG